MPSQASESLVLRTWPLREADLVVSFFTRDGGKLRGVARAARKTKNSFGAGLERLSHVTMWYSGRENRELFNLHRAELIGSQMAITVDYAGCVVLDFLAEASDALLPPNAPDERFFRLLLAVLSYLREAPAERAWPALNYFSLWSVRLSGLLPELRLNTESLRLAEEMLRTPVAELSPREWSARTAADLRRLMVRTIQDHIERRLLSAALIETL
ncbi:MAG TPA: DNA repair protein RecO [Bryobacteraceae bacterium]|nr:DNA repair protein RecO [Bryobacteraceae bacterium]